jgi:hypothetical protein
MRAVGHTRWSTIVPILFTLLGEVEASVALITTSSIVSMCTASSFVLGLATAVVLVAMSFVPFTLALRAARVVVKRVTKHAPTVDVHATSPLAGCGTAYRNAFCPDLQQLITTIVPSSIRDTGWNEFFINVSRPLSIVYTSAYDSRKFNTVSPSKAETLNMRTRGCNIRVEPGRGWGRSTNDRKRSPGDWGRSSTYSVTISAVGSGTYCIRHKLRLLGFTYYNNDECGPVHRIVITGSLKHCVLVAQRIMDNNWTCEKRPLPRQWPVMPDGTTSNPSIMITFEPSFLQFVDEAWGSTDAVDEEDGHPLRTPMAIPIPPHEFGNTFHHGVTTTGCAGCDLARLCTDQDKLVPGNHKPKHRHCHEDNCGAVARDDDLPTCPACDKEYTDAPLLTYVQVDSVLALALLDTACPRAPPADKLAETPTPIKPIHLGLVQHGVLQPSHRQRRRGYTVAPPTPGQRRRWRERKERENEVKTAHNNFSRSQHSDSAVPALSIRNLQLLLALTMITPVSSIRIRSVFAGAPMVPAVATTTAFGEMQFVQYTVASVAFMIILLSLSECIHSLNLYRRGKRWSPKTSAVGLCIQRMRAHTVGCTCGLCFSDQYDHDDELECEGTCHPAAAAYFDELEDDGFDSEHDHHVHDDLNPRDNDEPFYDSSCRYDENWFAPRQRQAVAWNGDDGSDTDSDNGGDHALPKPTDANDDDTDSEGEDTDDEDEGERQLDVSFDPFEEDEEPSSDFWPTAAALTLSAGIVVPVVTAIMYLGAALSWMAVGAIFIAVTVLATELAHIYVSPHFLAPQLVMVIAGNGTSTQRDVHCSSQHWWSHSMRSSQSDEHARWLRHRQPVPTLE